MAWKEQGLKKAYPCNADVLLFFREQRGWTQAELAQAAGYSERLVSKAEAGQSISAKAINSLAESLNRPEQPVYAEDLISDPLAMAKAYTASLYELENDAFEKVIRHLLHEEVVFKIAGDPQIIPFAGEHHGIPKIGEMFKLFFSILQAPENHDHTACYKYVAQGNEVMLVGESWLHPIGKPLETPMHLSHHMLFQRGKMILMEDIFDTHFAQQVIEQDHH